SEGRSAPLFLPHDLRSPAKDRTVQYPSRTTHARGREEGHTDQALAFTGLQIFPGLFSATWSARWCRGFQHRMVFGKGRGHEIPEIESVGRCLIDRSTSSSAAPTASAM